MNTFTLVYERYKGIYITQNPVHETRLVSLKEFANTVKNRDVVTTYTKWTAANQTKLEKQFNAEIGSR